MAANVAVVVLGPIGTVLTFDVLDQQVAAGEGQLAALGLADVRFDAQMLILVALHCVILDPVTAEITQSSTLPIRIRRILPSLPLLLPTLLLILLIRKHLLYLFLSLPIRPRHNPYPFLLLRRFHGNWRRQLWNRFDFFFLFRGGTSLFGTGVTTVDS